MHDKYMNIYGNIYIACVSTNLFWYTRVHNNVFKMQGTFFYYCSGMTTLLLFCEGQRHYSKYAHSKMLQKIQSAVLTFKGRWRLMLPLRMEIKLVLSHNEGILCLKHSSSSLSQNSDRILEWLPDQQEGCNDVSVMRGKHPLTKNRMLNFVCALHKYLVQHRYNHN